MDFLGICDSENWDDSTDAKDLHDQLFSTRPHVRKKIKRDGKTKTADGKKAARKNIQREKTNQPLNISRQVSFKKKNVPQNYPSDSSKLAASKEKKTNKKRRESRENGQPSKKMKMQVSSDNLAEERELNMKTGNLQTEKNSRGTEKPKRKKRRKRKPRNNKFKTVEFGYTTEQSRTGNSDGKSEIATPVLTGKSSADGVELNTVVGKDTKVDLKTEASKQQHLKKFLKNDGLGHPRTKKQKSKVELTNVSLNSPKQKVIKMNSERVSKHAAADQTKSSDKLKIVNGASIARDNSNKTSVVLPTKPDGRAATEFGRTENMSLASRLSKQAGKTPEEDDKSLQNSAAKEAFKCKMEARLSSAHFRYLNEQLYRTTGRQAQQMMLKDKEAFHIYHRGFAQQVSQWPVNPVDRFIEELRTRPVSLIVGDFGCGDARIARCVKQTVHSFDLCPLNEHVTACNMEKVPLKSSSLDIAIFCLSLMGTNWINYIKEANRVLKLQGELKVAEVASRFASAPEFLKIMKQLGFRRDSKDFSNKMFLMFHFIKVAPSKSVELERGEVLRPCLYKRR